MAEKREPAFPNVPTLKELGLNYSMRTWRGITLPKGTSADIVAVYEKAVDKIVKSNEFVDFMNDGPFTILYKGSADFSKFLDSASGSLSGPHISVVSPRSVSASALPS